MSQDLKDSLQVFASVLLFALVSAAGWALVSAVDLPKWVFVLGGVLALVDFTWLGHGLWKRRYRETVNG